MPPPFSARAALLQALRHGPGYGLELVERIRGLTGHLLSVGGAYPALDALKRQGLVRAWEVVPGRHRGGRARTYYELTYAGLQRAQSHGAALSGLLSAARRRAVPPPPPTPRMLRKRLDRLGDLTDFLLERRFPRAPRR